jgi:hypothetical protein
MNAQRFDWVPTAGYEGIANSYNGAITIARDSQGNLYTLDSANGPQQCQGMTATPATSGHIYSYTSLIPLEKLSISNLLEQFQAS